MDHPPGQEVVGTPTDSDLDRHEDSRCLAGLDTPPPSPLTHSSDHGQGHGRAVSHPRPWKFPRKFPWLGAELGCVPFPASTISSTQSKSAILSLHHTPVTWGGGAEVHYFTQHVLFPPYQGLGSATFPHDKEDPGVIDHWAVSEEVGL